MIVFRIETHMRSESVRRELFAYQINALGLGNV